MPSYQGMLDGLCGPYAVLNALEHCGVSGTESLFMTACSSLAQKRWPEVLWGGTTFGDLRKIIRGCKESLEDPSYIKVSYPFLRKTPKSNDVFWKRFDELYTENPSFRCVILRTTRPSHHWIVASRDAGKRIRFIDTDPFHPLKQKNRKMLFAGSKNGHPKVWLIDRRDVALFEVKTS